MKVSIYSPLFNVVEKKFDYAGALDNWAVYADQISLAINTSKDGTYETIRDYAAAKGYPVSIVQTDFSYDDPFCYGKIVNAALQNSTGTLLIEQDLDERIRASRPVLLGLDQILNDPITPNKPSAFWVPTIDLYGSVDRCLPKIGQKWYIHRLGLFRGAVGFGMKADGRPDYDKTSTDELIDSDSNLVPTAALLRDHSVEGLRPYVERGLPLVYHLGYVSFADRLDRSLWWKAFWEKATGDPNRHPTSIEEIANRVTVEHGLPLWPTIGLDNQSQS